jgi:hypothetical protein
VCAHTTLDDWYPQRDVCPAAMQLAAANRRYDAIHKNKPYHDGRFLTWADKPSALTPFHHRDGVRLYVARYDVNPDDQFLTPPGGEHGNPQGEGGPRP